MSNDGSTLGGIIYLLFVIAVYAYFAIALQTMAKKTNTANAWMAWIPLFDLYLLIKIGGKPGWWFILFLIPIVNIVMIIVTWMAVAERLKRPSWYGILMIIPLVNLVIPGVLAFSNGNAMPAPTQK